MRRSGMRHDFRAPHRLQAGRTISGVPKAFRSRRRTPRVRENLRGHFRLGPASGVGSSPALPYCPTALPGGAQDLDSGQCCRASALPRPPVPPDRDDRGVATAGVIGAISGHPADRVAFRDQVEQPGQNGAVNCPAVVCWQTMRGTVGVEGDFHRHAVPSCGVHGQKDLAPLASALNAILARRPCNDPRFFRDAVDLDTFHLRSRAGRGFLLWPVKPRGVST